MLISAEVKPGSPAEAEGLEPGLLIAKVVRDKRAQAPESSPKQFQELAGKADELTIYVQSKDGGKFVTLAKSAKKS